MNYLKYGNKDNTKPTGTLTNLEADVDGNYNVTDFNAVVRQMKAKDHIKNHDSHEVKEINATKSNTLEEISKHLLREYTLATITTEMRMHKARQTRMSTDIQRYFNSTLLRSAFARWMAYGYLVNRPYTISTLCTEMFADRKTISLMIKECADAGWIQTTRLNNQLYCLASPCLVESFKGYIEWRRYLTKATIGKCFLAMKTFEEFTSIDVTQESQYSTDL